MKRSVTFFVVAALLLLLLLIWARSGRDESKSENSTDPTQTLAAGDSGSELYRPAQGPEQRPAVAVPLAASTNQDEELLRLVRRADEAGNLSAAFFGLVMDQDSNILQNVSVDLEVIEEYSEPLPDGKKKGTRLQKQTGADGRFELSGLKGKYIAVYELTKAGYEQEFPGRAARYGAQSGTFSEPIVFRMWSTNLHEPLIGGEKSFQLIPDGRQYAIDLLKCAIAEGDAGDLVVRIKRPEKVERGQRFDWDCELAVSNGGLIEGQSPAMFIAPEAGYTNLFAYREQANSNGSGSLQDKRFYVRLRGGQMYGRIVISLYPIHRGGMIQLSYAVNPSGSRLLR